MPRKSDSRAAVVALIVLLVMHSAFVSAVLLLGTSFDRSIKDARTYVVPLMVVCLAPRLLNVMPGLELKPLLSPAASKTGATSGPPSGMALGLPNQQWTFACSLLPSMKQKCFASISAARQSD